MARHGQTPEVCADTTRARLVAALDHRLAPLVRLRWAVLLAVAVAEGVLARGVVPPDLGLFAGYGREIVGGRLAAVYADSVDQSGPLQSLLAWLLLPSGRPGAVLTCLHVVGNAAVLLALLHGSRWLRRGSGRPDSPQVELLVGAFVVAFLLPGDLWNGHLSQVLVPALWMAGTVAVRGGRPWTAGALLGLAVGVEPWGVLAGPVLLAGRGLPAAVRAVASAVVVTLALYLPFVLTGHFAMFEHVWPLYPETLLGLLQPGVDQFSWWLRLLQGGASAGACLAVVLALRNRPGPDVVWLPALAAALVRFALDPTMFSYYVTPVAVAALIGLGCVSPRRERPRFLLVGLLAYLPCLQQGTSTVPATLVALAVLLAATVEARRRQTRTPDDGSGSPTVVAEVPRLTTSVPAGQRTRYWSPDALS